MTKQANTPKSRKPATKNVETPSVTSVLAAQLAAQPAQNAVKPAEKAPRSTKTPDIVLVIAKEFKPRTNQTVDRKFENKGNFAQENNWLALKTAITAAGGSIAYAAAVQAVLDAGKAGGYEKTCNARGFVQGRVRNGHLTPKATA